MRYDRSQNLNKIVQSEDLLNILLDCITYLEDQDLFVYQNWMTGEVIGGPFVKRYWVKLVLQFDGDKMPDPEGALRLTRNGTKVAYQKMKYKTSIEVKSPSDIDPETKKPKMVDKPIWVVYLQIPRRFIKDVQDEVMDLYGEEVDSASEADSNNQVQTQGALSV